MTMFPADCRLEVSLDYLHLHLCSIDSRMKKTSTRCSESMGAEDLSTSEGLSVVEMVRILSMDEILGRPVEPETRHQAML